MTALLRWSAALLALACAVPTSAKVWKEVRPLQEQRTFTIADEGVTATVTPAPDYSEEDATIEVRFPGLPAFRVPKDQYRESIYGIGVGIGRLNRRDVSPTVFLGGYSGGAHCCATLQVVSLVDGRPVVETLPMRDGNRLDRFPRDIDGDGTAEIRWSDDSLLYQFSGHAGSWEVPRIYAIRQGRAVDISRDPGFAPIYRAFARKTLNSCRKNTTPENGDCAAYAYAMAILGQAEEGISTAASFARPPAFLTLPEDCEGGFDDEGNCPEDKLITFDSFEPALRYLMRKNGYLP